MIQPNFRALLLQALKEFALHGYRNETHLQEWLMRLHAALERELPADAWVRTQLAGVLDRIFRRDVVNGAVMKRVPGITRYTLDRISPSLRAELDRRIFAGIDLIRLNKRAATQKTLQRFAGWVSSVPRFGSATTDLRAVASEMAKPVAQVKYEARRVAIDQGHKLSAAVAHVVAQEAGAIAAIWHDRGQYDHGYDARPEHLKRSGKLFLVRDSWAISGGLIKKSGLSFTDSIEQPAELPYCSCAYEYITTPRDLPTELLTAKGRAWLESPKPIRRHDAASTPVAMRSLRVHGLDVAIETAKGETRMGIGTDGKPWSVTMPAHYGFVKGTLGADGDEIDCYIGPERNSEDVYIVDQADPDTGAFDEQKVLLGFGTEAEALLTYQRGFSDGRGRDRIGAVHKLTVPAFRLQMRAAA